MSQTFTQAFNAARRVGVPLLTIRTPDQSDAMIAAVRTLNGALDRTPIIHWDLVDGLTGEGKLGKALCEKLMPPPAKPKMVSARPFDALVLIGGLANEQLFPRDRSSGRAQSEDTFVFMKNFHRYWDDASVVQAVWNLREKLKPFGIMLVMLTKVGSILPTEIAQDVVVVDQPLPTEQELREIIERIWNDAKEELGLGKLDPKDLERAVGALSGLPAFPAEQGFAMNLTSKGIDFDGLWERKRQVIEQTRGLSVWRGAERFADIGGCENFKKFARLVIKGKNSFRVVLFMDEIEKAVAGTGGETNQTKTELVGKLLTWMQDKEVDGILALGPPGAAKTAVAKALANEAGGLTMQFDLAGMQSSLVGSSNENLSTGLAIAEAVGRGPTPKLRVLVVGTCNKIEVLPPELRRRFTLGTFFFDLPTEEERELIWAIYLKKYSIDPKMERPDDTGWTGAEIKTCCSKSDDLGITLLEASTYIVPVAVADAAGIKELREKAKGKFISASEPGFYDFKETAASATSPSRRKMRRLDADVLTGRGEA